MNAGEFWTVLWNSAGYDFLASIFIVLGAVAISLFWNYDNVRFFGVSSSFGVCMYMILSIFILEYFALAVVLIFYCLLLFVMAILSGV